MSRAPSPPHPAELRADAERLDGEALALAAEAQNLQMQMDTLTERARATRAEAAALRARADRIVEEAERRPVRAEPLDSMTAATALAIEDLGEFTAGDLAELIELPVSRVIRILRSLMDLGQVVSFEPVFPDDPLTYRAVDPLEAQARDAARELGSFTYGQWADKLGVAPQALTYYRDLMLQRGSLRQFEDGALMYLRPDPDRTITSHPTVRPPERNPPAYTEARARGQAVRLVDHGERGRLASTPGNRLRIKLRDQRYQDMQEARAERAEKQRARSQRDANKGKKR